MTEYEPYDDMPIHDEHVPEPQFSTFVDRMPQVCVEVVLNTDDGVLVGKRTSFPEVWFWPGARLYKGERLTQAVHRIADEELGIDVDIDRFLGVHAHFWDQRDAPGPDSRHTVNQVYLVEPAKRPFEIELDDQHSDVRFITEVEPDLHPYVKEYLREYDLV